MPYWACYSWPRQWRWEWSWTCGTRSGFRCTRCSSIGIGSSTSGGSVEIAPYLSPAAKADRSIAAAWLFAPSIYILGFLGYDVFAGIRYPRCDNATYPFGAFAFYSVVHARPPYDRHQPFDLAYGRFDVQSSQPIPANLIFWLHVEYAYLFHCPDFAQTQKVLRSVLPSASTRFDLSGVQRIDMYRGLYSTAAYPARASVRPIAEGLVGSMDSDGQVRALAAVIKHDLTRRQYYLEMQSSGYADLRCRGLSCLFHSCPKTVSCPAEALRPKALRFQQQGNRLYFDCPQSGFYLFSMRVADGSLEYGREEEYLGPRSWLAGIGLGIVAETAPRLIQDSAWRTHWMVTGPTTTWPLSRVRCRNHLRLAYGIRPNSIAWNYAGRATKTAVAIIALSRSIQPARQFAFSPRLRTPPA